jgi:hypothetical protein
MVIDLTHTTLTSRRLHFISYSLYVLLEVEHLYPLPYMQVQTVRCFEK